MDAMYKGITHGLIIVYCGWIAGALIALLL